MSTTTASRKRSRAKKSTPTYTPMFGNIVSAKRVDKVNSYVHRVELPNGVVATLWNDESIIAIGTRVLVDYRSDDNMCFM